MNLPRIKRFFLNKTLKMIIVISSVTVFVFVTSQLFAEKVSVKGNSIVFMEETSNVQLKALLNKSATEIKETCNRLGRFLPAESSVEMYAYNILLGEQKKTYEDIARELNLDIYFKIKISGIGKSYRGIIDIFPVDKDLLYLKQTIIVDSRVMMNIPLKLCRELAYLHRFLPVKANVIKKVSSRNYVISAGQWHGIHEGRYRLRDNSFITVKSAGRYTSLVDIKTPSERPFFIEDLPQTDEEVSRLERKMEMNIDASYGLGNTILKSIDPEKQFLQGTCVINTGANACLPGYGSYLATGYMGFEKTKPDYAGIFIGTGVILTHLTLTEFMTGFKSNFFPWIRDEDKTEREQNLHWFLAGTLPLGMTASYFHQLAYQYEYTRHLPPFFQSRDEAAVCFSVIVPGGGLFYKGYRFLGWSYYFSEVFLGAYGFYNTGRKSSVYAFSALGLIKFVEIVHSALAPPSYDFYNYEIKRGYPRKGPEFMMSMNSIEKEDIVRAGLRLYLQ